MTGVLTGALVISSGYALMSMNRIGGELVAVAEFDIPLTKVFSEITQLQLKQSINFERALRFGEDISKEPVAAKYFKEAMEKFDGLSHKINEEIKNGEALAGEGILMVHAEEEQNEFKNIDEGLKKIQKEHEEYAEHAKHTFAMFTQGKMHDAFESAEKMEIRQEGINHEVAVLLGEIEAFTGAAANTAEHEEQAAFTNLVVIFVVSSSTGWLIAFLVIRGIIGGLKQAIYAAEKIADGNLTEEIHSTGSNEISTLLRAQGQMRDKLHAMITKMNQASTELAAASEELTTVSEESNKGIHRQQGESQQAATAMNEMTATIHEVAQNAQLTSQSANDANAEVKKGQEIVTGTIDSMQTLANVVENATTVIEEVGQESNSISTMLDVIKSIAEQTNLLALNAAIEAARAGDQGRGFAVVADEVRTLAQRTQESASEIEDMISRLQNSSKHAVDTMVSGRDQTASSVEHAAEAGVSLEAITKMVSHISEMNIQIAAATEEQSTVAEEVNRNVNVISEVAEQNAASTNQITASSEELSRMAVNLQDMISQFKV